MRETKNEKFLNKILCADSLKLLLKIEQNSIDLALTDPPYFLDKLDSDWDDEKVNNKKNQYVVKSLPAGMKFDKKQGERFYDWYYKISKGIFRVLKPGAFFFSFSSPRLYHKMTSAVDDAGFLIKDCFLWIYTQNQPKAMSLNHIISRQDTDDETKQRLKNELKGWKTPQIKSCFEPISVAQKPPEGTFLKNMVKNKVGLFNTEVKVGENMFPSNVLLLDKINSTMDKFFLVSKPSKKERGEYNNHKTVKSLAVCEHIIKLAAFSKKAVVLDPFVGSGTTAVAAKNLGRNYIGIEVNKEYVNIALKRLKNLQPRLM